MSRKQVKKTDQSPESTFGTEAFSFPVCDFATVMNVSIPVTNEANEVVGWEPGFEVTLASDAEDMEVYTLSKKGITNLLNALVRVGGRIGA